MRIGEDAMGRLRVEIGVCLFGFRGRPYETADFSFLQLRPLVPSRGGEDIRLENVEPDPWVCQSSQVLSHGRLKRIYVP